MMQSIADIVANHDKYVGESYANSGPWLVTMITGKNTGNMQVDVNIGENIDIGTAYII